MAKYKALGLTLPLAFSLTALFLVPGHNGQEQTTVSKSSPSKSRRKVIDVNHFPIVEFSASELGDAKRKARGEKHNKSDWAVSPDAVSDSTVKVDGVDLTLPALPIDKAAAVVIGTVAGAKAYLSNDKTGVYSSFNVLINDVLKNSGKLMVGNSIEVEREGGRVKLPSGRLHLYMVPEQDMPHVGGRYVFFLAKTSDESVFEIISGYEIRQDAVYPLDDLPQARAYESFTPANFLNELRTKITNQ
jgi:hypothetical protein